MVALAIAPLLPRRNGPQQQRLVVVHHRSRERAEQLPSVAPVQVRRITRPFEKVGCRARLDRHELVRVDVAANAVRAELLDGAGPWRRPDGAASMRPVAGSAYVTPRVPGQPASFPWST